MKRICLLAAFVTGIIQVFALTGCPNPAAPVQKPAASSSKEMTTFSFQTLNPPLTGTISGWDTSKVTDMLRMFSGASAFNQDISAWSNFVEETIPHAYFSVWGCPLLPEYHPYQSRDKD